MFQAILPIRGKIINVEKARIDRVLKNNEVQSLITALGTGIHDDFDMKAALSQDRADGRRRRRRPAHPTLLLTLLFRFMRPLIELGHVYLAEPPLYKIKWTEGDDPSTRTPTASGTAWSGRARRPARSCPRRTPSSGSRASAR